MTREAMEIRRAMLAGWLHAHRAHDAVEQGHVDAMLALLSTTEDPFTRTHFLPGHFTASAFVVSPDNASLLLILHKKLKRWLQPGGHVEADDADVLASARREAAEEVQLADLPLAREGIFDVDVHDIPAIGTEPAHKHFDVRFALRAPNMNAFAGDEVSAAKWFFLDELNTAHSDPSVLRAVHKLLGR
jgi:8-oxo-dGTP pyrophosphatase MutT (NUDIX family)